MLYRYGRQMVAPGLGYHHAAAAAGLRCQQRPAAGTAAVVAAVQVAAAGSHPSVGGTDCDAAAKG